MNFPTNIRVDVHHHYNTDQPTEPEPQPEDRPLQAGDQVRVTGPWVYGRGVTVPFHQPDPGAILTVRHDAKNDPHGDVVVQHEDLHSVYVRESSLTRVPEPANPREVTITVPGYWKKPGEMRDYAQAVFHPHPRAGWAVQLIADAWEANQ